MIWKAPKLTQPELENVLTESFLYNRFKMLILDRIKWKGPEEQNIQERHIEEYLFGEGCCLVFEDKLNGILCLPCSGDGKQNVYGDFTKYTATGNNYTKTVKAENCVLIENNKLRMPTHFAVLYFVNKLYELSRSADVNAKQLRLQTIFTANDKDVLTVKSIIDEIDKHNWAIVKDDSLKVDDIVQAIQTGVKCLLPDLRDEYNAVMNEALTYFGINNSNTDKRERLITDEANANNQFIDSCAEMFLESRQRACEEINKKFGLNWKVEIRNKREEVNIDVVENKTTDSE